MKNILIQQLQEQFNQAKPQGAGSLAPRNGYVYIREIEHRKIGKLGQLIPVAQVNWKPEEDRNEAFLEDAIMEMALSSLYGNNREEKTPDYAELLHRVIYIHGAAVVNEMHNGIAKAKLSCKWNLLEEEPVFQNARQLTLASIFSGVTSGASFLDQEAGDADDGTDFFHEAPEDKPSR